MTNDTVTLGSEWFRLAPLPQSEIDAITPLLDSGDRETYLRGWISLMVKALLFADPQRQQLQGEDFARYLREECVPLMTDDDFARSIHTVLRVSREFNERKPQ
jgi:hypothetical protein